MPNNDLPTLVLMETLRVGACILLVAGFALVAGSVLTETMTDPSQREGDPFAGFGFAGAVGLGIGSVLASIPMWTTFRAIQTWQRAIAPRDLHYPPPLVSAGEYATIRPNINAGVPPAQFAVTLGQLPAGMSLDRKTGVISGTPWLKEAELAAGEARYRVTITARNLKGSCRTALVIVVVVRRSARAAEGAGARDESQGPPVTDSEGNAGAGDTPVSTRLQGEAQRREGLQEAGEESAGGRQGPQAEGDLAERLLGGDVGAGARGQADDGDAVLSGLPGVISESMAGAPRAMGQAREELAAFSVTVPAAIDEHHGAVSARGEDAEGNDATAPAAIRQVDV